VAYYNLGLNDEGINLHLDVLEGKKMMCKSLGQPIRVGPLGTLIRLCNPGSSRSAIGFSEKLD
jgi:hypothetical protein